MSIMIATSWSRRALPVRIRRMIVRIQSCRAWAMLSRMMSMPARMSFSSIASLSVAGPSVAMILVRRKVWMALMRGYSLAENGGGCKRWGGWREMRAHLAFWTSPQTHGLESEMRPGGAHG